MTLSPLLPWPLIVLLALVLVVAGVAAIATGRGPWWSWALRIVAVLCLVVVALRPAIPASASGPTAKGALEVYVAIDTTSSMAAEDWDGDRTRLEGIKQDVAALADQLAGAQFALVTFDSTAVQRVPLTADGSALVSATDVLTQEITQYSRGSSVDAPVDLLTTVLTASAKAHPNDQRVLFYLGDGEQTASQAPGSFSALAPYLSGGGVLGYGTTAGGRMKVFNGFGDANGAKGYIQDTTQTPPADALSRIDEKELESIASDLGVTYTHRTAPGGMAAVTRGLDVGQLQTSSVSPIAPNELYWWFAIPVGLVLLVELAGLTVLLVRTRAPGAGGIRGEAPGGRSSTTSEATS